MRSIGGLPQGYYIQEKERLCRYKRGIVKKCVDGPGSDENKGFIAEGCEQRKPLMEHVGVHS